MAKQKIDIVIAAKDQASRAMSNVTRTALGMAGAFISFRAIKGIVTDVVGAYSRQEIAETKLQQALKATKEAAGYTFKQLKEYAAGLQKVTDYGDEATIEMMSLLATFKNVQGPVFARSTELILDMSKAMDQDLKSTAIQVGKALNDPIKGLTALSRVGVSFTEEQKLQIEQFIEVNDIAAAQKIILQELASEFGGQARAAAKTFTGQLKSLANAWSDAKEKMGGYIAQSPIFIDVINASKYAVQDFSSAVKISWISIKLALLDYWEDFKFLFTDQIPNILGWFSRNFVDVLKNATKIISTVFLNMSEYIYTVFETMVLNLKALFSKLWEFIKNPSKGFDLGGLYEDIGRNYIKLIKELNPFETGGIEALQIKWNEALKFKHRDKTDTEQALENQIAELMKRSIEKQTGYKLPDQNGNDNYDITKAAKSSQGGVRAIESRFLSGRTQQLDPQKQAARDAKAQISLLKELVNLAKKEGKSPRRFIEQNLLQAGRLGMTSFM